MKALRRTIGLAVMTAALVASLSAAAQATRLEPLGQQITIGYKQLLFNVPGFPGCQVNEDLTGVTPSAFPAPVVNVSLAPQGNPAICVDLSGSWTLATRWRGSTDLKAPAKGVAITWPHLPGCRLVNTAAFTLVGTFVNTTDIASSASYWVASGIVPFTWEDNGATCALSGTTLDVKVGTQSPGTTSLWGALVTSVGHPTTTAITVGP